MKRPITDPYNILITLYYVEGRLAIRIGNDRLRENCGNPHIAKIDGRLSLNLS